VGAPWPVYTMSWVMSIISATSVSGLQLLPEISAKLLPLPNAIGVTTGPPTPSFHVTLLRSIYTSQYIAACHGISLRDSANGTAATLGFGRGFMISEQIEVVIRWRSKIEEPFAYPIDLALWREYTRRNPDCLKVPPECPEDHPDLELAQYFDHVSNCENCNEI
jgi:hypothetical protein